MADNQYLDLYKLETTESLFSVVRVIDEDLQNSPGCQLPEDIPLTLDLPPLIDPPPYECQYDIDVPLVPLPYVCSPTFSGDINTSTLVTAVIGSEGHALLASSVTVEKVDGSDCDYELVGGVSLDIEFPLALCQEGMTATSTFPISITGNHIGGEGTLTLAVEDCDIVLAGSLSIFTTLPEVICEEFTVTSNLVIQSSSGYLVVTGEPSFETEECTMTVGGTVDINLDLDQLCGAFTASSTAVIGGEGSGLITVNNGGLELDFQNCEVTLSGTPQIVLNLTVLKDIVKGWFTEEDISVCDGASSSTIKLLRFATT